MEQGRALHETEPRLLPWEEHLVALHPSWLEAEAASGHDTPSTRGAITQSIAELRALGAEATPESETARQRLGHALSQFAKVAQENSDRVGSPVRG